MLPAAHGDIVMGTPLLAALRRAFPDAHLTWIVEHSEREAMDANPFLDECVLWDSRYWKRMVRRALYPFWLFRALRLRQELRRRRYDVYISLKGEEWPLLVHGVGAPLSVGVFDTFRQFHRATRTSRHTRLYTRAYAWPDIPPHRVDQDLLPLQALGLPPPAQKTMYIGYTAEDAALVGRFLEEHPRSQAERLIVIAPMTTWATRCWPAERYAELGDALAREYGARVVLIGSAGERDAVARVASRMRTEPILAAGVFGFRQMAALIARASLLVSGDTGPMHVAAAVGTPYVALFGPTPVAERAPLEARGISLMHPVPCGPCDQKRCPNAGEDYIRCMRLITVEEVRGAARALLARQEVVT